jgi:hypothetical protein
VRELSIDWQAIAIIAFLIHAQFIHIARGFEGHALLLISFSANLSAFEPRYRGHEERGIAKTTKGTKIQL